MKTRLNEIVKANPWLNGRLVKDKNIGDGLYLKYAATAPNDNSHLLNPVGSKQKKLLKVDSTMSYFDICSAVTGTCAEVQAGSACVGKEENLVSVTVIADRSSPDDSFALIFSLSHVIGDGWTYYRLLSMLSVTESVAAMNCTRKHKIAKDAATAIGAKEYAWQTGTPVIFNVVGSMIFGKKALIKCYQLDLDQIKERKAHASNNMGVNFVSTNDIVVSQWGRLTKSRILLMPLNFRSKLPGYVADDAGNYEGSLVFQPDTCETPMDIRATLESVKDNSRTYAMGGPRKDRRPLPGTCETLRCDLAMVTNWTFSCFQELNIHGCEQKLHLPQINVSFIPFNMGVIFRPQKKPISYRVLHSWTHV